MWGKPDPRLQPHPVSRVLSLAPSTLRGEVLSVLSSADPSPVLSRFSKTITKSPPPACHPGL